MARDSTTFFLIVLILTSLFLGGVVQINLLTHGQVSLAKIVRTPTEVYAGQAAIIFAYIEGSAQEVSLTVSVTMLLIAADGATTALVEVGVVPHIVVTDLDGDLNAILYAASKGSKLFIHVHGDNIEQFTNFVEELKRVTQSFVVTTQVTPYYPVVNIGGFTDGDRAYALALAFRALGVVLAGMDFGNVVGRYSKPWLKSHEKASSRKLVKLLTALKIVSTLARRTRTPTLTLSNTVPACVKKAPKISST